MNRDNSYLKNNKFAKENEPNKTSFKKGSIPWNKGLKGVMRPNSGSFKKGQKGINWKPIGTQRIRIEKSGTKRRYIKIKEPNIWIEFAKYIWLRANRKLRKGFCLHHISRNSLDDKLENLILVSRQDHPKLHNRWNTKNSEAEQQQ
jgi:hypothetical protein